jgi:hypothetical protein
MKMIFSIRLQQHISQVFPMRFPKCPSFNVNHIVHLLLIGLVVSSVAFKKVPVIEIVCYKLVFKAKVFLPAGNRTQTFTST